MGLTRILSIDGGGVKGIIPSQILITLENILQKQSGRKDARIADYFDLIAGTSVGGILTAMYLCPDKDNPQRPRFSAEEVTKIFNEECKYIFTNSITKRVSSAFGLFGTIYPDENIQKSFKLYLDDLKLSELLKPCLITAYDIEKHSAVFFNKISAQKSLGKDFYVRDIIRATSSVPIYFPVANIKSLDNQEYALIDGGVFAGNPAICALAEISKFKDSPTAKDLLILSIGTGSDSKGYPYDKAKKWGAVRWAIPALNILLDSDSETVDYQLRVIFDSINKSSSYLRIQTDLDKKIKLDDSSKENLEVLNKIGMKLANEKYVELYDFANRLILV